MKDRLAGSQEWVEFGGTCVTQKILGGSGNFDDNVLELPTGTYRAVTLRTFDPAKQTWSIWWLDGRNPGHLDVPVTGAFENGVGTFYAEDSLAGRPIRVRFRWSDTASGTPRWEQAFHPMPGRRGKPIG